jgi:hypothetical protein
MKKLHLIIGTCALLLGVVILTSCEGPAGVAGQDANATCVQCHNDQGIIVDHQAQAGISTHGVGGTIEEGGRNGCAPCHSSQGFRDVLLNHPPLSAYNTSKPISGPVPVSDCYTCHNIHQNHDSTDWSFTGGESFHMLIDSANLVIDRGEINNLCSHCHQPRKPNPMPSMAALSDPLSIKSYRYGPHYGAQGAIAAGKGGLMMAGSEAYAEADNAHASISCAECHMIKTGPFGGGHTWAMVDEVSGADNIAACKQCHTTTGKDFDFNGKQTEIGDLLAQLGTALDLYLEKEDGVYTGYLDIYDPSSNPNGRYQATESSSWKQDQKDLNASLPLLKDSGFTNLKGAAFINFMLVTKDHSLGAHNYPYTHALLKNTLESLGV